MCLKGSIKLHDCELEVEKECIPAAVAVSPATHAPPSHACPSPQPRTPPGHARSPPPSREQNDRRLPQTSFAGGNYDNYDICFLKGQILHWII